MSDFKSTLKHSNKLFVLLILLNVIYCVFSGDFKISISNFLQGTTSYIGFIIIWLIGLGFYIHSLTQIKNAPLARYYLLPISIILGLFLLLIISPWAKYGRNISNNESLLGFLLFYFTAFPVLALLYFNEMIDNFKSIFKKVIFICLAFVSVYLLIFFWDFYSHIGLIYAVREFILGVLIFGLMLIDAVLLLYSIYKLIKQKSKN